MWKSLFGRGKKESEVGGNKELLTLSTAIPAGPDAAFEAFVNRFDAWWPRDYTWGGDDLQEIGIEPTMNGACYEVTKDGERRQWGTVLACNPPQHLVIAWQIAPDRSAIENEAAASRVDVRFAESEGGAGTVLIVHRDFPRHGPGWEDYRQQMAGAKGWPMLMERFRAFVEGG